MKNKTKEILNVELPVAFALVPVLPAVGSKSSLTEAYERMANAAMQHGAGGGGYGGGYGGGGYGRSYNIPPEKTVSQKLRAVCLEHGKKDPNPKVHYEIRPIADVTQKKEVHTLCQMLADGYVDQKVAQAAAWNLNNDMSWGELGAKTVKQL
ncbi:MAG: hypothetical protein LBT05_04350, partial [Planctomycetaceae bacterium]|nr:hypothetical protein [Planctomycetaceae bacterium]